MDFIQNLDFSILDWIQSHLRCGVLDWLLPKLTALGNFGVFWIAAALVCLEVKRFRKCGVAMANALIIGLLVGNITLKLLVARDRPCWISPLDTMLIATPKDYSFPSCHTLSGFAAAVPMLRYHRKWGIAAVTLAAVIALSRLYLYVHFPSDVLVGGILGIAIALFSCRLTDRYLWKRLRKLARRFTKAKMRIA